MSENFTANPLQWGVIALWLERKTLIHEVIGASPAQGIGAPRKMGVRLVN